MSRRPGHLKDLVFGQDQELALLQRVGHRNAEPAREMVVAASRKPQIARLRAQSFTPDRTYRMDCGEPFERLGDVSAGNTVIAMSSLLLDRPEAAVDEPGEMRACGLGRHTGATSQL